MIHDLSKSLKGLKNKIIKGNDFMKAQLIQSMGSFILGTGATLVGLYSWLGTSDLQAIKDSVQSYVMESEQHASALLGEYNVTVDQANAEIKDYQDALKQANDNISQLITAYNQAEQEHQQDLADMEEFYLLELGDLESELARMQTRLDSQYESDMNAIIEQANAEINQANTEVADTKEKVQEMIDNSLASDIAQHGERHQLDTTGDKSVTSIEDIVPSEEQVQE